MPVRAVSAAQRARLNSWPPEIGHSDLAAHFTLTVDDLRHLRSLRVPPHVRLALAVQYCALPFLGYLPTDLATTPPALAERLARRLGVAAQLLGRYPGGLAERSRREHAEWVTSRAGWRVCGHGEWKALTDWLLGRAVERDDPALLFTQALEFLHAERIVRPGLDRIGRTVAAVRAAADREIRQRLAPLLTTAWQARLDGLLVTDPERKVAPLVWLHRRDQPIPGRGQERGRQAALPTGAGRRPTRPVRRPSAAVAAGGHRRPQVHPGRATGDG